MQTASHIANAPAAAAERSIRPFVRHAAVSVCGFGISGGRALGGGQATGWRDVPDRADFASVGAHVRAGGPACKALIYKAFKALNTLEHSLQPKSGRSALKPD